MCTDCNEITIPTGPTGAAGTNGTNGVKGDTGLTGANGQDGTSILSTYNSLSGIGTTADLVETSFFNYNIPANTLSANGDELEAYIYYLYNATNSTTFRIKLGSKVVPYTKIGAQNLGFFLKVKISRISQTSQLWNIEETSIDALGVKIISTMDINSSTVDLGTILAFEVTGQNNTVTTTNQLVLKKATLYKYSV